MVKYYMDGEEVGVVVAETAFINGVLTNGGCVEDELEFVWALVECSEEAREMVGDFTGGQVEIVVKG